MDRLESMQTLLAAVDAGSLSAASRQLGVPLATVSRKVSDLEAHLRTRLLNRSNRRLSLTDAGRSYVAACRRILDEIGEAERTAAGEYSEPRGDLVITAPIVFGRLHVLPVVLEFLGVYPEIDIRLALADRVIGLHDNHIDLAIRIGDLPDSSLRALRVGSIGRVTCGSPDYFTRRGRPERPADLASHDCITFEGLDSPQGWVFGAGKSAAAVAIRPRLVVNTAEAALDAAIAGTGIARLLSYQAAEAVRARRLELVLRDFESAPAPVNLLYAAQGMMPAKLRAFLDFAAPRLKTRVAAASP